MLFGDGIYVFPLAPCGRGVGVRGKPGEQGIFINIMDKKMKKLVWVFIFLLTAGFAAAQDNAAAAAADADRAAPAKSEKPVVAYLDIDYVFKNHPWTAFSKTELQDALQKKADEIENAKKEISALRDASAALENTTDSLKPFYEAVYSSDDGTPVFPRPQGLNFDDTADAISRSLVFSGADIRFNSPLDSVAVIDQNRKKIEDDITAAHDKEIWIEKQKFDTENDVKRREAARVKEILQDIYKELKDFSEKRNIAVVVSKRDILYGQNIVDITQEFTDRLKKTRKEPPAQKPADGAKK